jgi:hypothetical protein
VGEQQWLQNNTQRILNKSMKWEGSRCHLTSCGVQCSHHYHPKYPLGYLAKLVWFLTHLVYNYNKTFLFGSNFSLFVILFKEKCIHGIIKLKVGVLGLPNKQVDNCTSLMEVYGVTVWISNGCCYCLIFFHRIL